MYFKYPVSLSPQFVQITHTPGIHRLDSREILVAWNVGMRELADQMSRDRPAELPPCVFGRATGVSV